MKIIKIIKILDFAFTFLGLIGILCFTISAIAFILKGLNLTNMTFIECFSLCVGGMLLMFTSNAGNKVIDGK